MMKNKKYIFIGFLFILMACIYNNYYGIFNGNSIPNFKYESVSGLEIEKKHFRNNKKTLIIYFDTNCNSCKTNIFSENIFKLNDKYNIIYITSNKNKEEVKKFVDYDEFKTKNVALLFDKNNNFQTDFKIGLYYELPLFISYDVNKENKTITNDVNVLLNN